VSPVPEWSVIDHVFVIAMILGGSVWLAGAVVNAVESGIRYRKALAAERKEGQE
jgi:hypothetical protein